MKTIVFIGTQKSGSSREAIRAAERLGYFTVVLTDRLSFLKKREEFPDVHHMQYCDLNKIDDLKDMINQLLLRALDIHAIVSFVDRRCHIASLLSEQFGLASFSTEAIKNMEDKVLSREIIKDSPYAPAYVKLTNELDLSEEELNKLLPAVMKSPDSGGSKDVFKINSYREFLSRRKKLSKRYPGMPILIEEFLDGPQYLIETIVNKGKINIVAVFQQEITYNQRFIVTGYSLVVDPQGTFYEGLNEAVESIIRMHHMETGTCHLEMRYVKGQWKLVEINPRISGSGMNRMIEVGYGINLVKETLKLVLQLEPDLKPGFKRDVFAQHIILNESGVLEKVTGRGRASKCPGVEEVYVKPRKEAILTPPLSMGDRYAYVIATGSNKDEARNNAKYAASQIRFSLLPIKDKSVLKDDAGNMQVNSAPLIMNLELFKSYLIEDELDEASVNSYVQHVTDYFNWYTNNFDTECVNLQRADIMKYKDFLEGNTPLSINDLNSILNAIINYNEFLVNEEIQQYIVISRDDLIEHNRADVIKTLVTDDYDESVY